MKIVKWLSPTHSNRSGNALVRVEANEAADIEQMLALVDGDSVGHFGMKAELVKTGDEEPEYALTRVQGKIIGDEYISPKMQFGFDNASRMKTLVRYYNVDVSRD